MSETYEQYQARCLAVLAEKLREFDAPERLDVDR